MPTATDRSAPPRPALTGNDGLRLQLRVLAEFREMPGLRLTLNQASRLFDIEPPRCARILEMLVARGCLANDGTVFTAAGGGRRSA
jgi:hypothetical protein